MYFLFNIFKNAAPVQNLALKNVFFFFFLYFCFVYFSQICFIMLHACVTVYVLGATIYVSVFLRC